MLQNETRSRRTHFNALLAIREVVSDEDDQEATLLQRSLPTWAGLMHDIINHGLEMGWVDVSSGTKNTGRKIRQVKQTSQADS